MTTKASRVRTWLVRETDEAIERDAKQSGQARSDLRTRLIRGTRADVENYLLSEWSLEKATPEQAHALRDVEIEDAEFPK